MKTITVIALLCSLLIAGTTADVSLKDSVPFDNPILISQANSDGQIPLAKGVLEELANVLHFILKQAKEAVDNFDRNAKRLLDEIVHDAEGVLQTAKQTVDELVQEAKQNLTQHAERDSHCFQNVSDRLDQISAQAFEGLEMCFNDVVTRVNIVGNNLVEHRNYFVQKIEEIEGIARACVEENVSIIAQVTCVLDHASDASTIVGDIVSDVKDLLDETAKESISILNDARGCFLDVIRQAKNEVDGLLADVYGCLQGQNQQ